MIKKTIFIEDLKNLVGQEIKEAFYLKSTNFVVKGSETYIDVILVDRTGEIKSKVWAEYLDPRYIDLKENYVMVQGEVGIYKGRNEISISKITPINPKDINPTDYSPAYHDLEYVITQLKSFMGQIKKPHIKTLVDHFMGNEKIVDLFMKKQGGTKIHHSMIGGLAVHTLSVLRTALSYIPIYDDLRIHKGQSIDGDVLTAACILHDIGKLKEYKSFPVNKRTTCGIMQGHINLSHAIVFNAIQSLKSEHGKDFFPEEDEVKLLHCILASHGEFSQVQPACKEAVILAKADQMDSMVNAFDQEIVKDINPDEDFTRYNSFLGTYIYKK